MEWIAILAIYLAAFRVVTMGPSDDPVTLWTQMIAFALLFFVMPFHVMTAWTKRTDGKDGS
jgi:hypothetical protein